MKLFHRYQSDERGSAAIEGAFLFPLLALIGFGVTDLSMLLRQTHVMEQGLVSSGTYLARAENPTESNIKSRAKNIATYGTPDASGSARISGWAPANVTLNIKSVANNGQYRGNSSILVAELSTDHPYSGLGFIRLASGGQMRINVTHEERLVRAAMKRFSKYRKNEGGAVTVETSFLILTLIILTGGAIESGYAFFQWNGAQTAARTGARIAATTDPVATQMKTMTGLSNTVATGDAMPDYTLSCEQNSQSCNIGGYDASAMSRIVYGPDGDGQCGATSRKRRGMCDIFGDSSLGKVTVTYRNSGLGRAGHQADPAPLVTVTLKDVPLNFVFLDLVGFSNIATLPPVEATVMGEDLKNG